MHQAHCTRLHRPAVVITADDDPTIEEVIAYAKMIGAEVNNPAGIAIIDLNNPKSRPTRSTTLRIAELRKRTVSGGPQAKFRCVTN